MNSSEAHISADQPAVKTVVLESLPALNASFCLRLIICTCCSQGQKDSE